MKNIFLFIVVLISSNFLVAQSVIDRSFDNYVELDETTNIFVSGKMFDIVSQIEVESDDKDFDDLQEFVSTIQSFQMIAVQERSNPISDYSKGLNALDKDYEELLKIRDKENRFSIYIDETNGTVHEIVGIGASENEFIVFSLLGNMDLNKVGEYANKINTDGFSNLNKIKTSGATKFKAYPNPVGIDSYITVDVPEEMMDGELALYNMNGKLIKKAEANRAKQQVTVDGLETGTYIVKLSKEDVEMKKKIIIVQ